MGLFVPKKAKHTLTHKNHINYIQSSSNDEVTGNGPILKLMDFLVWMEIVSTETNETRINGTETIPLEVGM